MRGLILVAILIGATVTRALAGDTATVTMTRGDANAVVNAIAAISQPYKGTVRQGSQEVATDKFLDVSAPMRSILVHDMTVLKEKIGETARLQSDARQRLGNDERALARAIEDIAEEKITVEGLMLFTEADLQLDKNPQIGILQASALAVLEK